MAKLKIAVLSVHSSPLGPPGAKDAGGMSTYLRGISGALGASGHLVDIYTRASAGPGNRVTEMTANVRVISIYDGLGPLNKYELAQHTRPLSAMIDDFRHQENLKYDILFSHYWISGLVGQHLLAKWHMPHLLMFHTLGRAKNELCPGEYEPAERLTAEGELALSADLLVVAAQTERDRILNYYHPDPERVKIITVGLDRYLFRPLDNSAARETIGIKAEKIILSVGRLEPVKGFGLLLAAAAVLDPAIAFKVVIVGGDDQAADHGQQLRNMVDRFDLHGRVIFTGRVAHEDLPYYYNAAAVTVIPSYYESFGLVALESLACYTPLIAGQVGVIPELAAMPGSGSHIHMISERNPALWAAKIRQLISAPQQAAKEAADHLLDGYDWQVAAGRFTELCRSILKNTVTAQADFQPLSISFFENRKNTKTLE